MKLFDSLISTIPSKFCLNLCSILFITFIFLFFFSNIGKNDFLENIKNKEIHYFIDILNFNTSNNCLVKDWKLLKNFIPKINSIDEIINLMTNLLMVLDFLNWKNSKIVIINYSQDK